NTFLNTFDAPIMETNCTRRIVSTTPTQALAQMNGSFIASQATRFAHRLLSEGVSSSTRIHLAYRLAFCRPPTREEMDSSIQFLSEQAKRYKTDEAKALTDFCQALLSANEIGRA